MLSERSSARRSDLRLRSRPPTTTGRIGKRYFRLEREKLSKHKAVASPRPGHADLAGALKYDFPDARYVLERASARESTARVAGGAFAKLLLRSLGIEVASGVVRRVGRRVEDWSAIRAKEEITALATKDDSAELRGSGDRAALEGRGGSCGGHGRHDWRSVRGGRAWRAGRHWHVCELG